VNKSLKPIAVIGLAIFIMAAVSLYMRASGKEIVPWREDYLAAKAEAAATKRPMFLYFTAPWCAPCDYMKHTTWASTEVKDALAAYVTVKVNIDTNQELAHQYGIDTIPHVFIVDENGHVIRDYNDPMTADEFLAWIKKK